MGFLTHVLRELRHIKKAGLLPPYEKGILLESYPDFKDAWVALKKEPMFSQGFQALKKELS